MRECGIYFCHSTYERACISKVLFVSKMEELMEKYRYEYEDILDCLVVSKNWKGLLQIWKKTLQTLKMLKILPPM